MKTKTTDEIISALTKIYGDKYDYSKTVYNGAKNKFIVICPKHGEISVRYDHFIKNGCPICNREKNKTTKEEFIRKAREIHGYKYEYNNLPEYLTMDDVIEITCPTHGVFKQKVVNHILQKQGCAKCFHENRKGKYKMTTEEFIAKAKKVHDNKYDYSKTVYNGLKNKLTIICPKHGAFEQVAYDHLRGFKCAKCKHDEDRLTTEEFISKAKKIHGDKYDYSKTNYISSHTPIIITCPTHGDFTTHPAWHLMGCGCHFCTTSRLENELKLKLNNENINYISQFRDKWLGKQSLDFYLPEYNIAIECQGSQHFRPSIKWGGVERFNQQQFLDKTKLDKCQNEKINLLYYGKEPHNIANYYTNIDDLILKIKQSMKELPD